MNPSPACFPLAIHFQNLGESKRAKRFPVFLWHGGGGMTTLPTRTWMASFFFLVGKGRTLDRHQSTLDPLVKLTWSGEPQLRSSLSQMQERPASRSPWQGEKDPRAVLDTCLRVSQIHPIAVVRFLHSLSSRATLRSYFAFPLPPFLQSFLPSFSPAALCCLFGQGTGGRKLGVFPRSCVARPWRHEQWPTWGCRGGGDAGSCQWSGARAPSQVLSWEPGQLSRAKAGSPRCHLP